MHRGAGMIMLAMVLTSVGLPVDGIALVAGVDRIFDMGRTTVNITGDAACTMVVSNLEAKREAKKIIKEHIYYVCKCYFKERRRPHLKIRRRLDLRQRDR